MRELESEGISRNDISVVAHKSATGYDTLDKTGKASDVVADAGIGFEPQLSTSPSPESGGFGLFSIRERLHLLGGEMTIDSAPGRGTRVTLVAPVQEILQGGDLP